MLTLRLLQVKICTGLVGHRGSLQFISSRYCQTKYSCLPGSRTNTFTPAAAVRRCRRRDKPTRNQPQLVMRDMSSSYWFQVGDRVRVVEHVFIRPKKWNLATTNNRNGGGIGGSGQTDDERLRVNLFGRVGTVKETWEKCDVDPTCCCAEQVDIGMAVRVEFMSDNDDHDGLGRQSRSFMHYFAESELVKVKGGSVL